MKSWNKQSRDKLIKTKGFTLVELLVVMFIVSVILGLTMASLRGTRRVGRDTQRKAEIGQIRTALEVYRVDNGLYPEFSGIPGTVLAAALEGQDSYIQVIPVDPLPATYHYYYHSADGSAYTLCAHQETGEVAQEVDCVTGGGRECGNSAPDDQPCHYLTTNP